MSLWWNCSGAGRKEGSLRIQGGSDDVNSWVNNRGYEIIIAWEYTFSTSVCFSASPVNQRVANEKKRRDWQWTVVTWGTLKVREMKMRERKMRHHTACHENTRHENAAPKRRGENRKSETLKCETWNCENMNMWALLIADVSCNK